MLQTLGAEGPSTKKPHPEASLGKKKMSMGRRDPYLLKKETTRVIQPKFLLNYVSDREEKEIN